MAIYPGADLSLTTKSGDTNSMPLPVFAAILINSVVLLGADRGVLRVSNSCPIPQRPIICPIPWRASASALGVALLGLESRVLREPLISYLEASMCAN